MPIVTAATPIMSTRIWLDLTSVSFQTARRRGFYLDTASARKFLTGSRDAVRADLVPDFRRSPTSVTAVVLLSARLSMPTQQRLGCNDCGCFSQELPPDHRHSGRSRR